MEPFVLMGGQVGKDISIWRDMSKGKSMEQIDLDAKNSVAFLREAFKK
jgi:D-psicose/D-tagatose/L-ribulose 3-epimerase